MAHFRRRGTAIVETEKGILVAAGRRKVFLLPGGNAKKWESRRKATIRELKEETNLDAFSWRYLFTYYEPRGTPHRASHKVFLVKAKGHPKPSHHDVRYISYWRTNSSIRLSRNTRAIIERYLRDYKQK